MALLVCNVKQRTATKSGPRKADISTHRVAVLVARTQAYGSILAAIGMFASESAANAQWFIAQALNQLENCKSSEEPLILYMDHGTALRAAVSGIQASLGERPVHVLRCITHFWVRSCATFG